MRDRPAWWVVSSSAAWYRSCDSGEWRFLDFRTAVRKVFRDSHPPQAGPKDPGRRSRPRTGRSPGRITRSQKRSNRGLGLGCKLESG